MVEDTPIQILIRIAHEDIMKKLEPNISSANSQGIYVYNIKTIKDFEDICYWNLLKYINIDNPNILKFDSIDSLIIVNELTNIHKRREILKLFNKRIISKDAEEGKLFLMKYQSFLNIA